MLVTVLPQTLAGMATLKEKKLTKPYKSRVLTFFNLD